MRAPQKHWISLDNLTLFVSYLPPQLNREATFNHLKGFRPIATRYDKLARNYTSPSSLRPSSPSDADRVQNQR